MFTIHEGEIMFKEKYANSSHQRFYVKPPDQENIIMVDESCRHDYLNFFSKIFLPQGYPNSVSKDYLAYQIWDTAQCFCSTVTGILATQEVLRGVGVGDTNATPLAATITWVLKDGCGHIGRILFAYSHGSYLDAYSKKWRLYADTLNDVAMCLEIGLPFFSKFFTAVLCVSTVLKAIVGVAGGATRAAMTQHHAIRGNMADVSAKDSAQETAVNLIASIFAVFIISIFGNSFLVFVLMMIHHIIFNYLAVRAVCLRTLNEPRFLQVIDSYLREEIVATPCTINRKEPIIFYQMGSNLLDLKLCGFKIIMGYSMAMFMKQNKTKTIYVKKVQEVYEYKDYMLLPDVQKKIMYVTLKDTATTDDILCSYFHAVLLAIVTCAINDFPLAISKASNEVVRPFAQVCQALNSADWSREEVTNPKSLFRHAPSIALMEYLDKIAQNEWDRIRTALSLIGWDLSKHLLIVEEWRLCTAKLITKTESVEDLTHAQSLYTLPSKVVTFGDEETSPAPYFVNTDTYTIEPEHNEADVTESSKVTKIE